MKPYQIEGVETSNLKCLNGWPEGTVGYGEDQNLIHILNELCKTHGYGAVPAMAAAIEEIWRDPDKGIKKWEEFRKQRLELFSSNPSTPVQE